MIRNSDRKLNNKGFSLIELIISISILVIVTAIATASYALLDGSYVKDAERGLMDSIALARTRAMSVSAREWKLVITTDATGSYYAYIYKTEEITDDAGNTSTNTFIFEKEELGNKLQIAFGSGDGSVISSTNQLTFIYDPTTGKVKSVTLGGTPQNITSGVGNITITRNDYKAKLKVYYNTGKCERE